MTADLAISTQGICRSFGSLRAVDNLTLTVPAGTIFGFLGPNGSGKTTTIRLLLGLLAPDAGSARVLGFDTRTQAGEIRERAGALLEHPGLYERLTAEDNLALFARIWRLPSDEAQRRVRELLGRLELWDRRKEKVGEWSRGMKQKLAVARAMLHRPRLIFLDEPTAGLDPVAATALRRDLMGLAQDEGVTVFLTTHNLSEAETMCSQVGVIRQGRLLAVGHPDELRARTSGPEVQVVGTGLTSALQASLEARPEVRATEIVNGHLTVHLNGDVSFAPLVQLMVNQGAQIEEIRRRQESLEQVFLALVEEEA
jgi:ABC-2 type transport system ATP-binding protein